MTQTSNTKSATNLNISNKNPLLKQTHDKDKSIRITEVGLRDGLQNEKLNPSLELRKKLVKKLIESGLINLEIGSFVSPKWVPSMACSEELVEFFLNEQSEQRVSQAIEFSALVPNEKGLETALRLGLKEIALFASCTETFSQKNLNCTIEESFKRMKLVSKKALQHGIKLRGYLSTCFGCPFEGAVEIEKVVENVARMLELGVYEVSLGDTIGLASAGDVEKLFTRLLTEFKAELLAGHFHDTRGQALVNILKSFEMGIRSFDSSIGGLGGCPYAPGATGNVATEDVVYMFNSLGISSGIDLDQLLNTNKWLSQALPKNLSSRVGIAHQFNQQISGLCFK